MYRVKERMCESLSRSLIKHVEEDVCVRLSSCGYGSVSSLLLSLVEGVGVEKNVVELCRSSSSAISKRMPWCGVVLSGRCSSLKYNLGLYTQCMNRSESLDCAVCERQVEKNGGVSLHGRVEDRMSCGIMEYKDVKGRGPISYIKIMKKFNLKREDVELEASKLGWEVPECHFDVKAAKRGRPKKDSSAEEKSESVLCGEEASSSSSSSEEKKKRGRPKKEKEIVNNEAGEDLIASLVKELHDSSNIEEELCEEEEEEEEETTVKKFEFNGTTYLKSDDHILYDMNSHEGIGIWNEETQEIEKLPDDDEE